MEFNGNSSSCEQGSLARELIKGMELTRQLKAHMGLEVSDEAKGILVEAILSSYEKALSLLNLGGSMEQSQQHVVPSTNVPGSPISVIGSPKSEDQNPGFNAQQEAMDFPRKRKMMTTWTEQVKASPDNGLEAPPDDGYSWRKYGQKDILGAKHPRSYYRCTYRNLQGCCAIKQVQRNDEDPSVFDITYKGRHTCTPVQRSKSAPTSPEKHEGNKHHDHPMMQQQPNVLLNFQRGLSVDIQNVESKGAGYPLSTREYGYENHTFTPSIMNDNNFFSNYSPSFIPSPANSTSNYFSRSPCNVSTFGGVHSGQHYESDIAEMISAASSGTNYPIIGIDSPLQQLGINPCFPFDNQVFFPSFSQPKE